MTISRTGCSELQVLKGRKVFLKGDILDFFFFMYDIQHSFICRSSDSTVSEDAGIDPREG
jgi:hypothetical protein